MDEFKVSLSTAVHPYHPVACAYLKSVGEMLLLDEDPREVVDGFFGVDLHGYRSTSALGVIASVAEEAYRSGLEELLVLHGQSSNAIKSKLDVSLLLESSQLWMVKDWHAESGVTTLALQRSEFPVLPSLSILPERDYPYTRCSHSSVASIVGYHDQ